MLICFIGDVNGNNIKAQIANPAVKHNLLTEILSWNQEGTTIDDVVARLRIRTVPPGHTIHNWIDGNYTNIWHINIDTIRYRER